MAMRRVTYKPTTLKQRREMAGRYFEFLASGMQPDDARARAEKEYQAANWKSSSITDLARFVAWRLVHLDDDWQEPPNGWMSAAELARVSDKRAKWLWVDLQVNSTINERAIALGVHPLDLRSEYGNNGEWKKLKVEIEAQYPDEAVCKELLIQHHNVIAGIDAPKLLPMPPLMIDMGAMAHGVAVTAPA